MENPGNQSEEATGGAVEEPPPASVQEQSASESSSQQQQQQQQQDKCPPPPLSPLTGSYLLIVVGEPHSERHKEIILQKIAKAFLSWDVSECHVSLEKELQVITGQSPEGEEARYGERLIQYATENLVTEILIHPQLNTLHQCLKNLLSSFTKHRHIIHAGYTFAGNGSWILQDGTLSISDLVEALHEPDVLRVLKAYENSVSVYVHCAPEGDWTTERFQKEPVSKLCNVRINPGDVMTAGNPAISAFIDYLSPFLEPANIQQLLQPTDVVGNIRFTHPTLYVFPGGQGDAALFGINGFNMLIDGGFARKACFWDFARHLDRLDAVLLTRLNNSTVNGISAVLQRKKMNHVYPQIGHFFCNLQDRKIALSPDGDKDKDSLIVNLAEEGQEIVANLRHLALKPHPCYRDGNQVDPVNLYHKVGHGKLDMYVISPARDSQAVKDFLAKWSSNDSHLFSNTGKKISGKSFEFPLQNLVSICALLVWQPANPSDTITRILFPGSTPQHKIFEGLEKLRHLEFLKHPVCSAKSISPSVSTTTVTRSLSKTRQTKPVDNKQKETKVVAKPQVKPLKPKTEKTPPKEIKSKLDNKLADEKAELETVEEPLKKLDNRILSKDEQIENIKKEIQKIEQAENEEQKKKIVHRSKYDMRNVKSKVDSRAPSKSIDRKKAPEKKPEGEASPPGTPKKALANGTATKAEKAKVGAKPTKAPSPTSTPAKSAKEANNRKVVEARVTTRSSSKSLPRKKEETPPPAPSVPAKTERKPISRRPKAPPSPVKSSLGKPSKAEPESAPKTAEKKTEINAATAAVQAVSQTISKGLEKGAETEKTEIEGGEGNIGIKKLEEETTENKETETKAVKNELESAQAEEGNKEEEEEEEEEEDEEEEYLIITKEEYGEDESGKENEEEVQTKDETEGEGEMKKLLREEEESEKKRETQEKEDLKEDEKEGEKPEETEKERPEDTEVKEEGKAPEERRQESPGEKTPEARESELQRLMDVDEGIDMKEPVSKEQKEGESLPEEKMSNTLETSATTAPTLPEDERIEEPVEEEKEQADDVKEVIEEKYIQEKTKEEKQEDKEEEPEPVEPEQPVAPTAIDVEGSFPPIPITQRKHPRDVVKTPDEVAELPMHEEVDPRMYSSGDFTKELQRKPEDDKPDFKATVKGEANFLDEDASETEEPRKAAEKVEPEVQTDRVEDAVITKYLNIIDELEKSATESKKAEEQEKEEKVVPKGEEKLEEFEEQKVEEEKIEEEKIEEGKVKEEKVEEERIEEKKVEEEKIKEEKVEEEMIEEDKIEEEKIEEEKVEEEKVEEEKIEEEKVEEEKVEEKKAVKTEDIKRESLELEKVNLEQPSDRSTPQEVEKIASGKSTPLDLGKEASGKSTPLELEKESSRISTPVTKEISGQATPQEASGKSTPMDLAREVSGKSTPQDKDISGKSTPHDLEKEKDSGKSTPMDLEKEVSGKSTPLEISGKSAPQDVPKEVSGGEIPQDLEREPSEIPDLKPEKEVSREPSPCDLEKVEKATPQEVEKSGKSSPQDIQEDEAEEQVKKVSGKSTPADVGGEASGKSTPQMPEEVSATNISKDVEESRGPTPQVQEEHSGKSTPLDLGKVADEKPEKDVSGKSTPQDLAKEISGRPTPEDSGKTTPKEKTISQDPEKEIFDNAQETTARPQEVPKELSGKTTPLATEVSGKATPQDVPSGKSTPLEKEISRMSTPLEKEVSRISTPEQQTSGKSTPHDLGKDVVREPTPLDVPSGKSTPLEKETSRISTPLEKEVSRISTPEQQTSGKSTPHDLGKDVVREPTPQDVPSGKSTPLEKEMSRISTPLEKEVSRISTPEQQTSGKSTPHDLEKDIEREPISHGVPSGKSTPLEKETSRISTPLEKEVSRIPTPLEKEASRISTPEQQTSGKSTPHDLEKDVDREPTSHGVPSGKSTSPEKEVSRIATPEQQASGKSSPHDLEKVVEREPTPQDARPLVAAEDASGKLSPLERIPDKDTLQPVLKDESQRSTPVEGRESGKEASGKTTPDDLGKVSGRSTPGREVPAPASGKTTPQDTSRRASQTQSERVTPSEYDKSSRRESIAASSPAPASPVAESCDSGKTTFLDDEAEAPGKAADETPEKEVKPVSGKGTPVDDLPAPKEEKSEEKAPTAGRKIESSDSVSSGPGEKDISGKSTPFSVSGKISPPAGGKLTSDSFSLALAEKGTSGTCSLEKETSEKVSSPSPVDISPLSLDELKEDAKEKGDKEKEVVTDVPKSPTQRKSVTEAHLPGKSPLERVKYEEGGSSGTSTPDRSHQDRSESSLPNGVESEDEPEKGILESERQEKESQILDVSSGEEEELKALGDDEDSEPEMRKDDLEGGVITLPKEIAKEEKDDINKLVKIGADLETEEVDGKSGVKRMLVTASSEDGGTETEICIKGGVKIVKEAISDVEEAEKGEEAEENGEEPPEGEFSNLILQARKEYKAQRSRKTSNNSSEESEEQEEGGRVEGEGAEGEEEELSTLLKQARAELEFVRSKNREMMEMETVKSEKGLETRKTTTTSQCTRMDDDDLITITTILTEEREEQEDGSFKVTTTKETTTKGGKNEGTVVTVNTNFEKKEEKKQDDEQSSSSSRERRPGTRVSREDGEGRTSQEEGMETSRRTSASSIISQEDLVSRKDSAKIEDFRQSSTEMSPLKTTYITSHGDSESLMTSSFYGNLPTEDEMIGRAEHLREFRKGRGYESVTEVGPNGERTERTYFYGSEDDPRTRSRFVKTLYGEEGQQKEGEQTRFVHRYYPAEIPEEETVERTRFVQQFYSEETSRPETEGRFRFVETVREEQAEHVDFAKAVDEHVSARGEYLGKEYQEDVAKYTNGKKKEGEEGSKDGGEKKDVIEGWGKPLGLPLPPKNKTYAFPGQNISTTSTLSTPTDNSDSVSNWGHPMNLPSPAPPPAVNGTVEALPGKKETPKKEKKIQPKKNISGDKSSGTNTPNRRSESPVKQIERRTPSTGRTGKPATNSYVYLDLTYVPHHGNSYYSNVEFFKKVRARYYVFSGTEPSKEVYNALLEAKQTWEDKKLEVTIIPTYDTDVLGYWVAENEEVLAKHKIDLSPSASRCTINLQDHETSCSAYRLEF